MARDPEMDALLAEFTSKLGALVNDRAQKRLLATLMPLVQNSGPTSFSVRKRQTCPYPGCENTAAPRYGMMCVEHKDLPKAERKRYRDERKALQQGAASSNGASSVDLAAHAGRKPGRRTAVPVR